MISTNMYFVFGARVFSIALLFASAAPCFAQNQPDPRAAELVRKMTPQERIMLLHGSLARPDRTHKALTPGELPSAGYTPPIARLGIPALQESDASLGIAWIAGQREKGGTALPSGLSLASSWDLQIAYAASAMIAQEARASGMNVLLAGGVDLTREPRNGRNFEYLGEDPFLAGTMAGETVRAIQNQHVLSTVKHYALNAQETGRHTLSADISEAAARESDLLAFEIAIERGQPGAVMCAYNRYNGDYSCGNDFLLNQVLKRDWQFPGFVMSDWGATHAVADALAGLDRESGEELDSQTFFGAPLAAEDAKDPVYRARITDMNTRILGAMFAAHLFDDPPKLAPLDVERGERIARSEAAAGSVLLKNGGVLPLTKAIKKIAVIGGYANIGVMSGGGSSQVAPASGPALLIPTGADGSRPILIEPGAPLDAIIDRAGLGTSVLYDDGSYPEYAAAVAAKVDVAIVFATQWTSEGSDAPNLNLPNNQDALIEAVASASPHTIVVLETGGPVLMPWIAKVEAVLEAWYPGIKGGQAIADIVFGDVNPSARLPITFPASLEQLPRPKLDGLYDSDTTKLHVNYDIEGSDVGYRWYYRKGLSPLFSFGYGLSYTSFKYDDLSVRSDRTLHLSFRVTNVGTRAGADTPQLYVTSRAGIRGQRLIGWAKVDLLPGQSQLVNVDVDPRLLADWSTQKHGWQIRTGSYDVTLNTSAATALGHVSADMNQEFLPP